MTNNKPDLCAMNCHHRFFELESFFSSARNNGYRYVEIWTGPQHFYLDYLGYEPVSKLKQLEERYQVKVIGVCPEQTNPKPNNMAIRSSEGQQRVFTYFKHAIDLAAEIKANQVVVTSGWAFYDEPIEKAFIRSANMLRKLSEYAVQREIPLAIEALQKEESLLANTAQELKVLLDAVNCSALNICLDIGAMQRAGDTIQTYFDIFGKKVIHSHFVDVNKNDTHIAWGDGDRNMADDLACFIDNNYQGKLSFECVNGQYFKAPDQADAKTMAIYNKTSEGEV